MSIISEELAKAYSKSLRYRSAAEPTIDLDSLSQTRPLMLVFMRHLGCTFAREALAELAAVEAEVLEAGAIPIVVAMSPKTELADVANKYGLRHSLLISDPDRKLYQRFGLGLCSIGKLFSWNVLARALYAAIVKGYGIGVPRGHCLQMPGVIVLYRGVVQRTFRHDTVADRPEYRKLIEGISSGADHE